MWSQRNDPDNTRGRFGPEMWEKIMSETKPGAITAGVLSTVVLAASVSADEFTDSLASIRRAMEGHWVGELSGVDASGEEFEVNDSFTFVVTSDDGLDSATWSAGSLEIAMHEGDGQYRIRNWNQTGRRGETRYRLRITEKPDKSGNGTWLLELRQRTSDGTLMETLEHFILDEDTLQMTIEMRPAATDEPFHTKVTGTWSRKSN